MDKPYPAEYTVSTMRIRTTALYRDWINHLKDRAARARIQVRVDRLDELIILLVGGDKLSQQSDIELAQALARNLQE